MRYGLVAMLALAMTVSACSGDGASEAQEPVSAVASTTAGPTTTLPAPVTTTTRGPRGSLQPVTIAFGGDSHFEGFLRDAQASDPFGLLDPITPILANADLAMVNLESAVTERGTPEPKEFTFRMPQAALASFVDAGIDVVSMANNHGLDYGPEGLEDSIAAKDAAALPIVGIGRNAADAYAPYRVEVDGQRIAFIGASQVIDGSLISAWTATDTRSGIASAKEVDRLVAAVAEARATSDTVVVYVHWGIEGQTCPSGDQQVLAQRLADAGADLIVGGHSHRVMSAGRLGGAFVAYGLGNFIWYARGGDGAQSGVLVVTVTGREIDSYQWHPAEIRGGVPHLYEGEQAAAAVARWGELRGCTNLTP